MGMEPDCARSFLPCEWPHDLIDFTSGIFATNLGENNARLQLRLANQLLLGAIHTYNYPSEIRQRYVDALCSRTGFECVALFCEGAVAVEAALRVMWANRPHKGIYCTPRPFMHGKTLAAKMDYGFELTPGTPVWPDEPGAGIILESYRGWDAHFWDAKWIQDLRAWCTENDALLCMDEIQSGFGRTGKFWAYEHYGIEPDLVVFGKAAGNGVPLSGVLGRKELLDLPGDLSATHSGHPLGCAAGLAVLEEFYRLGIVKEADRKGRILQDRLRRMWPKVNGKGMVAALLTEDERQANHIVKRAYERGLLLVHTGKPSVKIGPPLVISDEELNKGLDILQEVLKNG